LRTSTTKLRPLLAALALATATLGGSVASVVPAQAQTPNPFQRGPNPTVASVEAATGPFATATTTVSNAATPGFGAGTIYYPTSTAEGAFGAVVVVPGFTGTQGTISWLGPRLASQGFVVFTIDTNSIFDFPSSRADQLLAAADYLVNMSSVRTRVDRTRIAVMGHSMGGGGSLEAATDRPSLQAAVPLTGWHTTKTFNTPVPVLVVGAQNDTIAPVGQHSEPFYNGLPAATEKAYAELRGAGHLVPNSPNTLIAKYSISWLKRFVDNDARYEQFLCGAPHQVDLAGTGFSEYRETCPYVS
jgi:dienelactone hydrolase